MADELSNVNSASEIVKKDTDKDTIKIPKSTMFLVGGILAGLIIGIIIGRGMDSTGPTGSAVVAPSPTVGNQAPPPSPIVAVSEDDDPFLGDANAPVTIIEFTDFQCPFCGRHHSQTFPQIKSQYIDTGKVKYVVRDFPLSFHQNADEAANAANCANDQNNYFAMSDLLFNNQDQWANSFDPNTLFKGYGAELGLNAGDFDSCVDSNKYGAEIQADQADGIAAGVSGTPSFFINGQKLTGAQPFSAFQAAIEANL